MRKQYHFRRNGDGLDAWDVDRLIALTDGLLVVEVALDEITELDSVYWYDHGYRPTVRSVAEHARLIAAADLRWPIILDRDGRVMDGMHRVARALVEGHTVIAAVRLVEPVPPDFVDCDPERLPY
ncbi:MAG: hypothetical protein ACTHMS_01465 [Jatrophihabitans sp.]|uniref:hypothetical protein n=1 Tax=Jatrophihabitans sp. TaxID=1932789 RepID=UPI003F7D2943